MRRRRARNRACGVKVGTPPSLASRPRRACRRHCGDGRRGWCAHRAVISRVGGGVSKLSEFGVSGSPFPFQKTSFLFRVRSLLLLCFVEEGNVSQIQRYRENVALIVFCET